MASRRLYSLFEVEILPNGRKRYRQISELAFIKETAVRYFQNALLAPLFSNEPMRKRELRPVKQ